MMDLFKRWVSALGSKRFVFILSTMRSGSTLLKSLLATQPEVSHLPEVHFHKYRWFAELRLKALSEKQIIVLKKPSWVGEKGYPTLPSVSSSTLIVLIRHPYETILSIEKMRSQLADKGQLNWDRAALLDYWCDTYERLFPFVQKGASLIRYEDLTSKPTTETGRLFEDIGLIGREGVDHYAAPKRYQWSWMNDDGGEKIKSLKVAPGKKDRSDHQLANLISSHSRVQDILHQYGYNEISTP